MLVTYQKTIYGALREVSDALARTLARASSAAKKRNW